MPKNGYGDPKKHQRETRQPPFVSLVGIRNMRGLKGREVCARVGEITGKGFTLGALSAIENGHRGASPEVLAALEQALDIPAGSLITSWEPSHSRRKAHS